MLQHLSDNALSCMFSFTNWSRNKMTYISRSNLQRHFLDEICEFHWNVLRKAQMAIKQNCSDNGLAPINHCLSQLWSSSFNKNMEIHTAHTIISLPNHKQWKMGHASDLMVIMRWSTHILTKVIRMGKLNTHSLIYCMKNNWENWFNLGHTLDRMYLTSIIC